MNSTAGAVLVALLFLLLDSRSLYSEYRSGEYSSATIHLIAGFLLIAIGVALNSIQPVNAVLPVTVRLAVAGILIAGGGGLLIHEPFRT